MSNNKLNQLKKILLITLPLFTQASLIFPAVLEAKTTRESNSNNISHGFSGLAKKLLPSVVGVRSLSHSQNFNSFFGKNEATIATGSGFIYNNQWYIVTNNHVVENGNAFEVSFNDGTIVKAILKGRDPETDIAVLKLTGKSGIHPVSLANSNNVNIGDWAIAIGSPFGLGNSFSVGVISGRNRDLQSGRFDNFLQTDAAINSGNSGGPLFNDLGQVIGVNTAIVAGDRTGGNIGIGFAVPSNIVKRIADDIIANGYVRRGYAGFRARNATPQEGHGVIVTAIDPKGPAKTAGVKPRDRYFAFNNKPINDARQLARLISDSNIGSYIRLDGWRGKKRIFATIHIVLPPSIQSAQNNGNNTIIKTAGMSLRPLNNKEQYLYGKNAHAIVIAVDPFGKSRNSIKPGDVILKVAGQTINSPAQARALTENMIRNKKLIIVTLRRNNRTILRLLH